MIAVVSTDRGIPLYGPSGASAHLRHVTNALRARGDVNVFVPTESDGRGHAGAAVGANITVVPTRNWPRGLRSWGRRWDAAHIWRAAAGASWAWERAAAGIDAGARFCGPRILELNAPAEEAGHVGRMAAGAERRNLTTATRVVAVSSWLARWAVERGAKPERVRHVPNGSALTGPGNREAGRARWDLSGLVVVLLGAHRPWHGAKHLPALLAALPEAKAVVIGGGAVPIDHPRVRHLPHLEGAALADALSAADVGLAPYDGAPPWLSPLKLADYLAVGLPVVARDVGDAAHLLRDAGQTMPDLDPATWAEAVRALSRRTPRPRPRPWATVADEALGGIDLPKCA